jgi:23S rRNA (cytidine2498-2'-O)-methyltransferase
MSIDASVSIRVVGMTQSGIVSDVHLPPGRLLRRASRVLLLGQHGFEPLLARELLAAGLATQETGVGWVLAASTGDEAGTRWLGHLCFPHFALLLPQEIRGDSVNALAQRLAQLSFESLRGEEIEGTWPCVFLGAPERPGLGRRVAAVEKAFHQLFKKKLARIARLATPVLSAGRGYARGLIAYFTDFGRVFVSREVWRAGPRRMADDPLAPSRSYLKIEEAYVVMGREPGAGDSVCDLGASPGGWSYSAAKRGARVVAVDNGPLKGGALDHALIEHRREDAFRYAPPRGSVFEWMFCDLVEDPHQVLSNLVHSWLRHGWCRRFVVILKFGRTDALGLLREVRAADSPFTLYARHLLVHHLFHNREEFTVVGEVIS